MKLLAGVLLWCVMACVLARDLPGAPTAQERLQTARSAVAAGDWRAAIAELEDAVHQEPRNADIHNLLAYSYRKQPAANLGKAFEHYRMALSLDPAHRGAHEYIGEAYLADRKPQEAEKHLVALEKICGNRSCEEYVDLARAIAEYKKARP